MAKTSAPARLTSPPAQQRASQAALLRRRLIALAVVLIAAAALGRVVGDNFILFDDPSTIADNPNLNPPTLAGVMGYWNPAKPAMTLYVPLTYTVWGLCGKIGYVDQADEEGWHLNPYIFHAASLLVHLVNVCLLFFILSRLSGQDWAAALGALLFALHPLQVESVAWASGLKDLLSGMFILLAIGQYLQYSDATTAGNSRARLLHLALGALAVLLGMFAKPNAIVAPVMAAAIGYFILRQPLRRMALPLLLWLFVALPVLAIASAIQQPIASIGGPMADRPLMMSFTLAFYLFKFLWPAQLVMDYGWHTQAVLALHGLILLAVVPAGVVALLLISWRRFPWLAAAACLFLIGILPVLGLASFQTQYLSTVADHYVYPSMIGAALGLAFLLGQLHRPRLRRSAFSIAAAVLLALGLRSYFQLSHYTDIPAYFDHLARLNPGSFVRVNYGVYNYNRAMQFRLGAGPGGADPAAAARCAAEAEQYMARARENLDAVIAARPEYPLTYLAYAKVLMAQHDFDAAEQMMARFIQQVDRHRDVWGGEDLAVAHVDFARTCAAEKAWPQAREHLRQALAARTKDRAAIAAAAAQIRAEIPQAATAPAAW